MILESVPLFLSFFMAIYLFIVAFIEGIKIADSEGKVEGGTFIFSVTSAVIFTVMTCQY